MHFAPLMQDHINQKYQNAEMAKELTSKPLKQVDWIKALPRTCNWIMVLLILHWIKDLHHHRQGRHFGAVSDLANNNWWHEILFRV
jgi:hypothetical protein